MCHQYIRQWKFAAGGRGLHIIRKFGPVAPKSKFNPTLLARARVGITLLRLKLLWTWPDRHKVNFKTLLHSQIEKYKCLTIPFESRNWFFIKCVFHWVLITSFDGVKLCLLKNVFLWVWRNFTNIKENCAKHKLLKKIFMYKTCSTGYYNLLKKISCENLLLR